MIDMERAYMLLMVVEKAAQHGSKFSRIINDAMAELDQWNSGTHPIQETEEE